MNDTFHDQACNLCGLSFAAHGNDPDADCPVTATIPEVAPPDGEDGIEAIAEQATKHGVTVAAHRPTIQGYFEVDIVGPLANVLNFLDLVGWGSQFTTWTQTDNKLTCPENNE